MWIDDSVTRSANLAKRGPATSMWWSSDAESAWTWMTVICLPSSLKKALYTSGCTSTSRVWGMAVRAHDCQPQDARRGQRVLEGLEARDLAVPELPDLGHALAGLAAVQANRHAPEHHDRVAAVDPLLRHELERLVGAWDLREHVSADGLGTTMDAAVGQALDVCLNPLDVGRERSQHRLDLAASERAVQLLDLLEIGHVGNTKPSLPRSATRNSADRLRRRCCYGEGALLARRLGAARSPLRFAQGGTATFRAQRPRVYALRAAAFGAFGVGEGVIMLEEFLDTGDL